MSENKNLHNAKKQKNDEFYTQLSDIENELRHYKPHFKDKVVFCNCDDPYESNFFKYFAMNFNSLGLKKLIATGYKTSPVMGKELNLFGVDSQKNQPYAVYINEVTDINHDGRIDLEDVKILLKEKHNTRRKLRGDEKYPAGDFRSEECVKLLQQADIVVTNPPFSIAREYMEMLIKYKKEFLIIGDLNWITYKEIFPLLKNNLVWLGYNSVKQFMQADGSFKKFGNKLWFTNLNIKKRHEILDLYKEYNTEDYPKYINYNVIEVSKISDIPYDYVDIMGVPVTFLNKYNPEQFEIIGCADANIVPEGWQGMTQTFVDLYYKQGNTGSYKEGNRLACFITNDGIAKVPFKRVLIKRKYVVSGK